MITGILTAFKSLGVLKAASGALSFIPGLGMLPGIFSAVMGALLAFLKLLVEGVVAIVSNMATLATVITLGLVVYAVGIKYGHSVTAHRIDSVRAQHTTALRKIVTDSEAAVAGKKLAAEDAAKTAPQPETPTEIAALCQRSASCRERSK